MSYRLKLLHTHTYCSCIKVIHYHYIMRILVTLNVIRPSSKSFKGGHIKWASLPSPVLFNNSSNDLKDGTLSRFADDTKLGGIADTLQNRNRI